MPGYKRLPPTAMGRLHIEDSAKAFIVTNNRWANWSVVRSMTQRRTMEDKQPAGAVVRAFVDKGYRGHHAQNPCRTWLASHTRHWLLHPHS
jgi:hypothetical protein